MARTDERGSKPETDFNEQAEAEDRRHQVARTEEDLNRRHNPSVEGAGENSSYREGSGSETEEVVYSVRFNSLASINYHKAREGFLDSCHRFTMFIVLMAGSGAAASVVPSATASAYLALLAAAAGALDMVFAFSKHARDHSEFAGRFIDVLADCASTETLVEARALKARFYKVSAGEPATYEAAYMLAYNQALTAMDHEDMLRRITWSQRLFRHVFRYSGRTFPPMDHGKSRIDPPSSDES